MPRRVLPRPAGHFRAASVRRFLSLAAILAVASGVAVLDAAAEPVDGDDTTETTQVAVTAADLHAADEATRDDAGLTGSLTRSLWTPRGLSPDAEPLVDPDALDLGDADDEVVRTVSEPANETDSDAPSAVWDRLAQCESNGRWHLNTGNGFYGGLQFTLRSWRAVGGAGYPHEHPREVQIRKAERLLEIQGWRAWPACSRKLGLRG